MSTFILVLLGLFALLIGAIPMFASLFWLIKKLEGKNPITFRQALRLAASLFDTSPR